MKRSFLPIREFLLVVFVAVSATSAQANFEGKVIGVVDGDTIDVHAARTLPPIRVRLAEIDAPEKRQAFGQRAKQALAELVFQRDVWVIEQGRDRYGRVLGRVYIATPGSSPLLNARGPISVNSKMVEAGMAWAYRPYLKDDKFVEIEDEARTGKRGLWAETQTPIPPWQWRADVRRPMK